MSSTSSTGATPHPHKRAASCNLHLPDICSQHTLQWLAWLASKSSLTTSLTMPPTASQANLRHMVRLVSPNWSQPYTFHTIIIIFPISEYFSRTRTCRRLTSLTSLTNGSPGRSNVVRLVVSLEFSLTRLTIDGIREAGVNRSPRICNHTHLPRQGHFSAISDG